MSASQIYTEHSLCEYWNSISKSITISTSTNAISQEVVDTEKLKLLEQTIKKLVRSNDVNSDRILCDIDHLFLKFVPKKCKYFPFIMQQSFSDASAFNWCLHVTKGDMQLYDEVVAYTDQKRDTLEWHSYLRKDRWRRLWLVIYDNFEHLLNGKFTQVTCPAEIDDNHKVLRCKGKNYKEDNQNGKSLTKDQVEMYWQESLAPRIYTNINLIGKDSVNKDRDCVMVSLLCIKQSKIVSSKSAFRKIFKELIIPHVCINIIQDLQKSWGTLYAHVNIHIKDSLDRHENQYRTFSSDSAQHSIEFFKNYHTWYELQKEAALKNNSLVRDCIYKAFADTYHEHIDTIEEDIQPKKIQKKDKCVLC